MLRVSRVKLGLLVALVTGLVLVPTAAQADPSFYVTPLFGSTTAPDGSLLVADAGQGIVDGDDGSLVASLPGINDVDAVSDSEQWAVASGEAGEQKLYKVVNGVAAEFADILAFELEKNPHPATNESNAFDVTDLGRGEALVADSAGNTLLEVRRFGSVKLVAVFPDELVSTDNAKKIFGCPAGPPMICGLPSEIPAESVPTGVAIGPDGGFYVGELKGFPAPIGESRIWKIRPNARNVRCGKEPGRCAVALDGFTSIIDLAFGPDGYLYVAQIDDASFLAMEQMQGVGGSVQRCNVAAKVCTKVASGLPMLTSIAFRGDGSLWGTTWALVPGMGDAVQILP